MLHLTHIPWLYGQCSNITGCCMPLSRWIDCLNLYTMTNTSDNQLRAVPQDELKLPTSEATSGFPNHPHRGFETCSIMLKGKMEHRDHIGNHVSTLQTFPSS